MRPAWTLDCRVATADAARNHYLTGMTRIRLKAVKTAVSLPYDLFHQADATARRRGISRSELYAQALAEYLERRECRAITERLNAVYSRDSAKLDSALHRAQLKSFPKGDWCRWDDPGTCLIQFNVPEYRAETAGSIRWK